MRLTSAISFVLAAVAVVPALARPVWSFERSVDTLETRGRHDMSARAYDWEDSLVSRDSKHVARYNRDDLLFERDTSDEYERSDEVELLARELVDYLYARNGHAKHPVSVSQEEPGEDGLYHWKLVIGAQGAAGTVWHDVIWSDKKHVGMVHRGPIAWDHRKAEGHIRMWHLGDIDVRHVRDLNHIAATTHTPKYDIKDIDKNCHTWIEDVIKKAVAEHILRHDALSALARVPKA